MTPRQRLEQAIEQAVRRDPRALDCRFCGCGGASAEDRPLLGPVLRSPHYARTMADACPALRGGLHAQLVHEDQWAQLDPWLAPPADYGDDTELSVVNDELAVL